jgi:hypothetical protein
MKEAEVLRQCMQYLKMKKVVFWRSNTGAARFGASESARYVRFGVPGVSDVIGLLPPTGRMLALEIKSQTGRVRKEQTAFLKNVTAAGGLALVIRDVRELIEALEKTWPA